MSAVVPIVDISPWRTGRANDRDDVARAVDHACRSTGFFEMTGHAISPRLASGLFDAIDTFFALPTATKSALTPAAPRINRGYAAPGTEALSYSIGRDEPPDLFEAFNVGPDDIALDDPVYAAGRDGVFAPNIWPDLDGFRGAVKRYFDAVVAQAHELTGILATALGLQIDYFESFTSHSNDVLRTIHYPATSTLPGDEEPTTERGLGMGAHTDYGIVTQLLADPVPGLQILTLDGEWIDVLPHPGSLLVNLGDLLAAWTNDHWRSTLHRVLPPPAGMRRRSAAFFHDGNPDALIECLPTCTSDADPPRYAPFVAGDHVQAKLIGPRTGTASQAVSTLDGRDSSSRPPVR